ncbi:hypothetical protein A6V36_35285 [Paraburkholderia ginsengiterrae]|uniref:Uncharacterized protein n=2 Tax=Paraburkholderia ginsengiterrae TaxID=1462993 RepID=A0A1A9N9T0_9BURK|nr:hypothetical protein A6V36_35285 [Paraburkholderia ginsengiterrae]OAJ61364.1 hypothetical protein A6V37_25475 [Paraburkholderia ginsengiterrae]
MHGIMRWDYREALRPTGAKVSRTYLGMTTTLTSFLGPVEHNREIGQLDALLKARGAVNADIDVLHHIPPLVVAVIEAVFRIG